MVFESIYAIIVHKIIPFILALIGFGFLIAFHELGHYLMCKLFGIHTPTFSIGFGPTLISRTIGDTNFRLAPIPLGGYCEIAGFHEPGQGEQGHAHDTSDRSFSSKPYWQKFLVLTGGIMFNLFFAYATFTGFYFFGTPQEKASIVIHEVEKGSAAEKGGLLKKDIVIKINDHTLATTPKVLSQQLSTLLLPEIRNHAHEAITLTIIRNGEHQERAIMLESKQVDNQTIGSLGALFGLNIEIEEGAYQRFGFLTSIKMGIERTHGYIAQVVGFLRSMVSERTLKGAGGPIMMLSTSFSVAQQSISLLLIFLAIISINLAVLNILPLGALDGGQLLIVTIESITRRRVPESIKLSVLVTFWLFFLGLTLVLSYRDIKALF
jgi:regulator of sigma E protease